jgi:hypothetical protein
MFGFIGKVVDHTLGAPVGLVSGTVLGASGLVNNGGVKGGTLGLPGGVVGIAVDGMLGGAVGTICGTVKGASQTIKDGHPFIYED